MSELCELPAAMIATLGTRPEVVTIALDLLLEMGEEIAEVWVVHTASSPPRPGSSGHARDLMGESVREVRGQFPGLTSYLYHGVESRPIRLKLKPLRSGVRVIDDVRSEEDARAVFTTLFQVTQELKRKHYRLHLSIAGGRKSISAYGMAAAQLLFDSQDHLWHLLSNPEFEATSLMHPRSASDARLVPIPALPISAVFPGMVTLLNSGDPLRVLDDKLSLMDMEGRRDRELFLRRLTRAERSLVRELMARIGREGRPLSNQQLARSLSLAPGTVNNYFSKVYAKLSEHIGVYDSADVNREVLIYYLAPYCPDVLPP